MLFKTRYYYGLLFSSNLYFLEPIFTSNEKDGREFLKSRREYGLLLQNRMKSILVTTQQGTNKTNVNSGGCLWQWMAVTSWN